MPLLVKAGLELYYPIIRAKNSLQPFPVRHGDTKDDVIVALSILITHLLSFGYSSTNR